MRSVQIGVFALALAGSFTLTGCNWPRGNMPTLPALSPQRVPPPGTNSYSVSDGYYQGPALTSTGSANSSTTPTGRLAAAPQSFAGGSGVERAYFEDGASTGSGSMQGTGPTATGSQTSGVFANGAQSVRAAVESSGTTKQRMQLNGMPAIDLTAHSEPSPRPEIAPAPSAVAASGPPPMLRGQSDPPRTRLPETPQFAATAPSVTVRPQSNTASTNTTSSNTGTTNAFSASAPIKSAPAKESEAAKPAPATESKDLPWRSPTR